MLRRLVGLMCTVSIAAVLVRKFAPGLWTSGLRLVRDKASEAKGPTLAPWRADMAAAEAGLVPDPAGLPDVRSFGMPSVRVG